MLLGVLCLVLWLLEPSYSSPAGNLDVWQTFGPGAVLLLLEALVALGAVLSALAERTSALPVFAAVWSVPLGLLGLIAAIVRLLERPDRASGLCAGAWLALAGALLALAGAWQTLRDEHTPLYPARVVPAGEVEDLLGG
jgi:hypothetical protein